MKDVIGYHRCVIVEAAGGQLGIGKVGERVGEDIGKEEGRTEEG